MQQLAAFSNDDKEENTIRWMIRDRGLQGSVPSDIHKKPQEREGNINDEPALVEGIQWDSCGS